MATEKIAVTAQEAGDGDIAAFIRGDGTEWQDGSRYQQNVPGMGTGVQDTTDRVDTVLNPPTPDFQPTERLYDTDPTQQDFRQLYGQSENEKGQWRRAASDAIAELQQLKAEIASLRNPSPSYATPYGTPPGTANYAYGAPQANPAAAPQQIPSAAIPKTFFEGRSPDDPLDVATADAVLREMLAPAILQVYNEQQRLQVAQAAALEASAGITPVIKQNLLNAHPWLNTIGDPTARVDAMRSLLARPAQAVSPASAAPVVSHNPAQAAVRRVTYVESGRPSGASPDEGVPIAQRIKAEFDAARTAADKKAVLMKYGALRARDFGNDVY